MIISDQQHAFLDRRKVGRLGTASAGGDPHVVPVCFACLGDIVFIAIDEKPKNGDPRSLKRLRNIMANNRVCLIVDHYADAWDELGWVMLRGRARVEMVAAEARTGSMGIGLLRARYRQYRDMVLEEHPMIVIDVDRCTDWGDLAR
mgnify:CR=1 FL=1